MKRHIKKRVKGFFTLHFPLHVLALVILWILLNFRIWVIFLFAYLAIIFGAFLYEIFLAWRYKRERIYAKEVRRLMFLMRNIIDTALIYDGEPAKFYGKFLEMISVESLSARGIIDPDALLRTPKYNRQCKELRRKDAELWTLIMAGFKARELKVIYGLTNIHSVYVKRNRMRKRLSKKMQELLDNRHW